MLRFLRVGVAVALFLVATSLGAQTPPPSGIYIPCATPGRQVTLFSEGTAWQGEKWVWLTVFNPTTATQRVWVRVFPDGANEFWWTVEVPARNRVAWNMNDELKTQAGLSGSRVNFATIVEFSTVGVANIAVWSWDYLAVPVYLLGTNQCVTDPERPFTKTGTGDMVFDIPADVERVRITGTYTGSSQNFIVRIDGHSIVNELLGTYYGNTTYDGVLLTSGGTVVSISSSSGVQWSIVETY